MFQLVEEARPLLQEQLDRVRYTRNRKDSIRAVEDEQPQSHQARPDSEAAADFDVKCTESSPKPTIVTRAREGNAGYVSVLHIDHMNAPKLYTKNLVSIAQDCDLWLAQILRSAKSGNQSEHRNWSSKVSDISPALSTSSGRLENLRCVIYSTRVVSIEKFMRGFRSEKMDMNKRRQPCQERKATVLVPAMACHKTLSTIAPSTHCTEEDRSFLRPSDMATLCRTHVGLTEIGDLNHPEKLISDQDFDAWFAKTFGL